MADILVMTRPESMETSKRGPSSEDRQSASVGSQIANSRQSASRGKTRTAESIPSAVSRWKRQQEQTMMEKLVGLRNERKELSKLSRQQAQKLARKIPIEILAKDWLSDTEATLDVRAYLVDRVLPTLILGVEKLLNEADQRELTKDGGPNRNPNFNPINFLAQYLMRNNPKYSNFSEASSYVRGLREVSEELKNELFNMEDNRLARIKAEAKRRREERERLEMLRQRELEMREELFMKQFSEWTSDPNGRVDLSLLQNALKSFAELTENFPEHIREAAKFSHPLEPTDESGKALTVKEFAKYVASFVAEMPREIFQHFMVHVGKCAKTHKSAAQRETRRIVLSNLFHSCDHSGIGLLDRYRILKLFEDFWDARKGQIETNLRNPRKWPVVEVDEADDDISDDEEHEKRIKSRDTTQVSIQSHAKSTEEEKHANKEKSDLDKREKSVKTPEKEDDEESYKNFEETEEKAQHEEKEEEKDWKEEDDQGQGQDEDEDPTKKKKKTKDSETEPDREIEAHEYVKEKSLTRERTKAVEDNDQEPTAPKSPAKSSFGSRHEDAESEYDLKVNSAAQDRMVPRMPDIQSTNVSFAEGTTFEKERTIMTAQSCSYSVASAFDETILTISQFVQLTETFLGEEPLRKEFEALVKFIRDEYQETEQEKLDRMIKARKEALSSRRKLILDELFEKWDNDGSGYLDLDEVETIMQKYKDGQENEAIGKAKDELKKKSKHAHDNRLSKREFRMFITMAADNMPGGDLDYFVEFLSNSVEKASDKGGRTYAERIRGEARKKWLQQIVTAAETGAASMEPVYKAVFQALYKDAEAHGGGKHLCANIAMLERNTDAPERGEFRLRYVAATVEDADFLLGKCLYKDMPGISFAAIESGKPIHVPRVANHGNIQFWNPYRSPEEREGAFIVIPLKDRKKRVFGVLGIDTLADRHSKNIFITHEIQFFQGVAKSFSISYHHVDMSKKLLRITESAVSWIHRRSPHVREIITYIVEPDDKGLDFTLRKMMTTDKKGNIQSIPNPPRLERKDNLFRDYLFKCVDNSESVTADAYGERHIAFPLRDDQGRAVAVVDISIGETRHLPSHENREVQRMLRLLQLAHKEITREMAGEDKTMVLEAEKNDETRMDIMFDRLMLMELRENVSKIDSKAFAELRSYNDPPKIVHQILKAVCTIFYPDRVDSGELNDWTTMKSFINSDLLNKISTYDPTAGQELIAPAKIERFLKDVPHGEVAKYSSVPAQYMYSWIFVCLSLIEHTLKMRENQDHNIAPPTHDAAEEEGEGEGEGQADEQDGVPQ
ncbi:hypothetical protein CHS0354_028885 [Potamilus streckersoni]|uniref:EF-hand domain-containing protein n=1 Tax=Potamilus streckersoni TaxID=2493646 RepID=A0AAE0VSR8_9BIVA|nr:hypothetical protein CHS0354_028885 [Potamilus streckersoni]